MDLNKPSFILSLQSHDSTISPHQLSQYVRITYGWICVCRIDDDLPPDRYRAYMVLPEPKSSQSPENPAVYWCVVSGRQNAHWQHLSWTKEILQALDDSSQRTNNKEKLEAMLRTRVANSPNGNSTPPNIVADKNGFILALGCMVPARYREILRKENFLERFAGKEDQLADILNIPQEYVEAVIDDSFEDLFEKKLREIS